MAENNTTVDILNDLKPNSDKYKERTKTESEKNLGRIVTGNVSVKKKNDIQKFAETFVKEDLHTVKSYIWTEVLLPAFKAVISDSVNMMLYGETSRNRKTNNKRVSQVSYSSYYDRPNDRREPNYVRSASRYVFDDLKFEDRGDADEVLSTLDDLLNRYPSVSVADLNELVGITGRYTDNKYGWTDISQAYIERTRDGYILRMPKAIPLD